MTQVEITAIAADEAPEQSIASRAKFRVQFGILMISVGRVEMAEESFDKAIELLDELIEAGH